MIEHVFSHASTKSSQYQGQTKMSKRGPSASLAGHTSNVQLIKAATDAHLWAESYDRELQNIFRVEGEVADRIAGFVACLTGPEAGYITGANLPIEGGFAA